MTRGRKSVERVKWTNRSVHQMAAGRDPVTSILDRVRSMTFTAMEKGWSGPPYDPLELAELSGVELLPIEEVEEARLVHHRGHPRIEFNPNRKPERVRFSIAHELGHLAFPDAADKIRYRSHSKDAEPDAWQIELLCNLAAAELLMPTGSFPELAEDISLEHLIGLSARFYVSVEAALLRAVRLASQPACVFAAARVGGGRSFRLDYLSESGVWKSPPKAKAITSSGALGRCSAVGSTAKEEIAVDKKQLRLECVGAPPYPNSRYPRIVGLLRLLDQHISPPSITYLLGDATDPQGDENKLIVHVVNDKTANWGGHGFAPHLRARYPGLQESFRDWAREPGALALGKVHIHEVDPALRIATMVAQHGYGSQAAKIPLRYEALEQCMRRVRDHLSEHSAAVHMPRIGAGQAGGDWNVIAEMVARQLLDVAHAVTVYLPPGTELPETGPQQLGLLL